MSLDATHQTEMELTGERMVPSSIDKATFWEHVARYRFASQFVQGKHVLDIACGEGYGAAAMLRGGAASVVGVDISKEACDHVKQRYGIDARVGNAEQIPLADHSIDLVVSFETIEHVPDTDKFILECRRVLKSGGVLVISTPNKSEYHKVAGENRYHCSELEFHEFSKLLNAHFSQCSFYGQYFPTRWYWRTRGLGRVCARLQRVIIPEATTPLSDDDRSQVQTHILRPTRPFEKFLSPWIVRHDSDAALMHSRYIVAVSR